MLRILVLIFLASTVTLIGRAEEASTPPPEASTPTQPDAQPTESANPSPSSSDSNSLSDAVTAADTVTTQETAPTHPGGKSTNQMLLEKLKRPNGTELTVDVLATVDQTNTNVGEFFANTIVVNLQRYGHDDVRLDYITPSAINLENFRNIVVKTKSDVVLASLIKPTGCELFLFDKRTPYQIYYHGQDFPDEVQLHMTSEILEEFIKQALRRLLYSYIQNDSYDMPREITTATLKGEEVPYWIARPGLVTIANRDILSTFYTGVTVGGSLGLGLGTTSSVVGVQFGVRIVDEWQLELNLESFTYNAVSLAVKRSITFPDTPLQFMTGLGLGYLFSDHAIGYDAAYLPEAHDIYIVPSFAIVFPIVEVYLKFASEIYFSPSQRGVLITLGPGLFMRF